MPDDYTVIRTHLPETIVPGKRLGRHVEHDSRSLRYAHKANPDRVLVDVAHERHISILDQGDVGSCTGNAATGGLGTSPVDDALPSTVAVTLNETYALKIYSAAETIDGDGPYPPNDNGSSGLSAAKACKNFGDISGYKHALSITDALDALQDGPVLWGTNWLTGMDNPDSTGLIKYTGTSRGGHELVLRRYDAAKQLVGGDNSWGASWGANGSFWISVADLTKSLKDQGDITILVGLDQPIPIPNPPTPDPGAATFLVSAALAVHIHRAAVRAGLSDQDWMTRHLQRYFGDNGAGV